MKMIVAVDENWAIGKDDKLLCHLAGDLQYFKEQTLGAAVIMGRATLESLPGGKPLPGRRNIVLTSRRDYHVAGAEVAHSVEEVMELLDQPIPAPNGVIESGFAAKVQAKVRAARRREKGEFVIGGASVYEQFLDRVDEILVTKIHAAFEADTHFPNLDEDDRFACVWEGETKEENGITYTFTKYRRAE